LKVPEEFDFDHKIPLDIRMSIFKKETELTGAKVVSIEKSHQEETFLEKQRKALKLKFLKEIKKKKAQEKAAKTEKPVKLSLPDQIWTKTSNSTRNPLGNAKTMHEYCFGVTDPAQEEKEESKV